MTTADSIGTTYPNATSTDSSIKPRQLGLLWVKSGGAPLCADCLYNVRGYCSVGRQMTPTFECYEYMHQSYAMGSGTTQVRRAGELLENIVGAFAAYQPGDEQRSRDTRILDWIEEEKPDIWFRTGYGVWSVSAEMDDPEFPNYDGKTLREAVTTAMMAWEDEK